MKENMINMGWLAKESAEALSLLNSIWPENYTKFLANARKDKFGGERVFSQTLEREVLLQAIQIEENMRKFFSCGLRIAKHFKNSELFSSSFETAKSTIEREKGIDISRFINEKLELKEVQDIFSRYNVPDSIVQSMGELLGRIEARAYLKDNQVFVNVKPPEREEYVILVERNFPIQKPRNVKELLFANRFDAAAESFHLPDIDLFDIVHLADPVDKDEITKRVDPFDAMLLDATIVMQEITRHTRKLRDTNLATYRGLEPISVIATIGAAVAITGIVIMVVGGLLILACELSGVDELCDIGRLVLAVGGIIASFGIACLGQECTISPTIPTDIERPLRPGDLMWNRPF